MGWPCKKCGNEEVSVCMNCDSSGMDACDVVKCICCGQVSRDIVDHHCATCRMLTAKSKSISTLEKHIETLTKKLSDSDGAVKLLARELVFRRSTTNPGPVEWRYQVDNNQVASWALREAMK